MNKAQRLRIARGYENKRNPRLRYNPKKGAGNAIGTTDSYGTSYTRDASGAIRRGLKAPKVPSMRQSLA